MPRASSAEPPKPSKRKGTRSVSTLTPSQLARKRANDREAQRAIRARTKEHIERLERELEEFRSNQSRDKTVQDLLRRNRALEDELRRLKESMGASITSSPYSAAAVYDDNLSVTSSGAMPSPQMSPMPSGADFAPLPDYGHQGQQQQQQQQQQRQQQQQPPQQQPPQQQGQQQQQQFVSLAKSCDAWAAGLPGSAIPSSVSSPVSSVNTDEYGPAAAYIPTSMPASMMAHGGGLGDPKDMKLDFDDLHAMGTQSYMQHHQHHPAHSQHQRPQPWGLYSMYYDGVQNTACVSR